MMRSKLAILIEYRYPSVVIVSDDDLACPKQSQSREIVRETVCASEEALMRWSRVFAVRVQHVGSVIAQKDEELAIG